MSLYAASRSWLLRFKPVRSNLQFRERFHSAVGGLIGLLATAVIMRLGLGRSEHVPLLIAPIGASTVLVFGVPASPLAQPWSVVGGNCIAALIGVSAARLVPDTTLAAALAVGFTIALTSLCRCLHPPAGAVALTAVIGGSAVTSVGYHFALVPVLSSSLVLVFAGLLFNGLAGRSYPHVAVPISPGAAAPRREPRVSITEADITTVLERLETPLDVDPADLLGLFRRIEQAAQRRPFDEPLDDEIRVSGCSSRYD